MKEHIIALNSQVSFMQLRSVLSSYVLVLYVYVCMFLCNPVLPFYPGLSLSHTQFPALKSA